jgi:NADH-quinone oxidoreductase subunit H
VDSLPVLGIVYITTKTFLVYFVMLWVRMTLPRFRIDHLMAFNWKFLVPLSIVNLLVVGFVWKLVPDGGASGNVFERVIEEFPRMAVMGVVSLAIGYVSLYLLRRYAIMQRQKLDDFAMHTSYAVTTTPQPGIIVVTGGTD